MVVIEGALTLKFSIITTRIEHRASAQAIKWVNQLDLQEGINKIRYRKPPAFSSDNWINSDNLFKILLAVDARWKG